MMISRARSVGLVTRKAVAFGVGRRKTGWVGHELSAFELNVFSNSSSSSSSSKPNSIRFRSTISSTRTATEDPESSTTATTTTTAWTHVPSYPVVGSLIPQLSGIPDTMTTKSLSFWPEMRRRYGDFYTMGFPGVGNSTSDGYNTLHMVCDPREMVPVIKAGGSYPSGMIQRFWPRVHYNESRQTASLPMFTRGPEWKRLRTFMQKDLLHPESARGYVPGMILAAQLASRGAHASKHDLNNYMKRCSFDLFAVSIFGELTQVSDPNTYTEPDNERFITRTTEGMSTAVQMLLNPIENVMYRIGLASTKMKYCFDAFDVATEIGMNKIKAFTERKASGRLTINEENSYLSRALDRQLEPESNVTVKEVQAVTFSGLFAAVDTTASVMGWNLFHVARCPDVQEKLYRELKQSVDQFGGNGQDGKTLTLEALSKKNVPYLHAVIRESQRMTPVGAWYSKQINSGDVIVNGKKMKEGDVVGLDLHSLTMDPAYVEEPEEFKPERWLQDAVDARKNTSQEVVDHPFLKEPFSQGARKCPAARVAINEVQVLLAQLVLDWKITSPVSRLEDVTYTQKTTTELDFPELGFEARQ